MLRRVVRVIKSGQRTLAFSGADLVRNSLECNKIGVFSPIRKYISITNIRILAIVKKKTYMTRKIKVT